VKITETTPKVERTFTVELTERELRTINTVFGWLSEDKYTQIAQEEGVDITSLVDDRGFVIYDATSDFFEKEAI